MRKTSLIRARFRLMLKRHITKPTQHRHQRLVRLFHLMPWKIQIIILAAMWDWPIVRKPQYAHLSRLWTALCTQHYDACDRRMSRMTKDLPGGVWQCRECRRPMRTCNLNDVAPMCHGCRLHGPKKDEAALYEMSIRFQAGDL